ncbi:TPA: LlaJI family restriction endonuclease [Streptococcus suis]
MKIVYCREEFGYTFAEFGELLNLTDSFDEDEVKDILSRLKRANVISKVKATEDANLHKSDLSDIDDDDEADSEEFSSKSAKVLYKIKFVGLIVVKSYILYCFPKYIDLKWQARPSKTQLAEFKQITKVIEKYSKSTREQAINSLNEIDETVIYGDLSVSLFLLEDYFQNGLYSQRYNVIQVNGDGEILWDKTVTDSFAFFIGNRPVYLDYFNKRSINEDDNFIKKLHEVTLSLVSKTLESNGLLDLLDLTSINFTDDELTDLGDIDYILYAIESALNQEFNTHKQLLLKALYSYVSQNYMAEKEEYASLFGTKSFKGIWEKVCANVLDSKRDTTISSLGLEVTDENTSSDRIKDIIEKPRWSDGTGNGTSVKTLIPDIITIVGEKLLILDAKYYNLKFSPNQVAGNPGVGDVTKQYLYALAYKKFAEINNLTILNYFLMPANDGTTFDFGKVEMALLNNLGLSFVKVAKLHAPNIYQRYLNNEIDKELLDGFY